MTEEQFYQSIFPDLLSVIEKEWMPSEDLRLEKRKGFYAIIRVKNGKRGEVYAAVIGRR